MSLSPELKNFPSLINQNANHARERMARVELFIHEALKGRVKNVDVFFQDVQELLINLENIKTYVQQEEDKQIGHINAFLHHFFDFHILEKIEDPTKVKKAFRKVTKHLLENFSRAQHNEKLLLHEKVPSHSLFKKLSNFSSLDKEIAKDTIRELKTTRKIKELMEQLFSEAKSISLGAKSHQNFEKDLHVLITLIFREFDYLKEEFLDAQLQEISLIQDLEKLIHLHPEFSDKFLEIKKKVFAQISHKIQVERLLLEKVQKTQSYFMNAS